MKQIILCLDGTTISFGSGPPTNVLLLFRLLDQSNVCYYQPGVGTLFTGRPDIAPHTSLYTNWQAAQAMLDAALGYSLSTHVQAAYLFLVRFYSPGDKIVIFGFSRGSFTARVLAGMIEHAGLLRPGLEDMVKTAWELYAGWEVAGQPIGSRRQWLLQEFRQTFCRPAHIHFMGLWDTVSLVGLTRERVFPFSSRSSVVSHLRHAASIDERRCKYRVEPFEQPDPCPDPLSWWRKIFAPRAASSCSKDLVELWFPGNHSDVGGGWSKDEYGYTLSSIPFQWIVSEAIKHGVRFCPGAVATIRRECPVEQSLLLYHHDILSLKKPRYQEPHEYDGDLNPRWLESSSMGGSRQRSRVAQSQDNTPHQDTRSTVATQNPGFECTNKYESTTSSSRIPSTYVTESTRLLGGVHPSPSAPSAISARDSARAVNRFGSNHRSALVKPPKAPSVPLNRRPHSTGNTWPSPRTREVEGRKRVYTWPAGKITTLPSVLSNLRFTPKVSWPLQDANIVPVRRFNGRGNVSIFSALFWWLVEWFPFTTDVERADGAWRRQLTPNFGTPRPIPKHAQFHWSVFYRLRMVSDYNPSNLPYDLGEQFLELVDRVMQVPDGVRSTVLELNRDTIRTSDIPIWNVIPDDLALIE